MSTPDIDSRIDWPAALEEMRQRKDGAYAERNQAVALLAKLALRLGWRAGLRFHPEEDTAWEPDWRTIVFIDLPTGQVSWHFHDSERHLLEGLPLYPELWDGHDTPEKYRRVNAVPVGTPPVPVAWSGHFTLVEGPWAILRVRCSTFTDAWAMCNVLTAFMQAQPKGRANGAPR